MQHRLSIFAGAALLTSAVINTALAGDVEVIFTEIPGHPTAAASGTLDIAGNPIAADITALEDLHVRHDGGQWIVKGRVNVNTATDTILFIGSGSNGTAFAQEDQPFVGGFAGELYDFFDSGNPVVWDENGNIAFSARAKGGVSSVKEKLVYFDGVNHTHILTESSPTTGLVDIASNPTGDELIGNSIGSVFLLNNGQIGFVNTPIQNCSSFNYPAMFMNNAGFRQSGVSPIGAELWDSFSLSGAGGTPDGAHWFAIGDTDAATTVDEVLVVDDVVVIREGSPVAGSAVIADDTFACSMLSNGDWFARGDDAAADDWAVKNGVLIAKTGDPLNGSENYGNAFADFTGNRVGDWLLVTNTDNTNPLIDQVMVVNGVEVCRENDPIDLDGNGLFDDNVFIRAFQANDTRFMDDGTIYFLANLQDGAQVNLGDAFLRMKLCPGSATAVGAGCAGSGGFVPSLALNGCPSPGEAVSLEIAGGLGGSNALLFFGTPASIPAPGGCTLLVNPLPLVLSLPLGGAGAGTGSLTIPAVIPVASTPGTFDMQVFVIDGGVGHGFSNSNGVHVVLQ